MKKLIFFWEAKFIRKLIPNSPLFAFLIFNIFILAIELLTRFIYGFKISILGKTPYDVASTKEIRTILGIFNEICYV